MRSLLITWELQYFCSRSTELHKYTSSLSYLLPPDRSTEVLNIHTRYLHGNFSTSVTEVQKYTYNVLTWELQYFCYRSTEYPCKVPVWELQYFCHRSTGVHIQCSYMRTSVLLQQKYTSTQVPSKVTLGGTLEQPTPCTSVSQEPFGWRVR